MRFEEYIRLQNGLLDEERRQHADDPYTLGDHLHWYLQIPRRVYRGYGIKIMIERELRQLFFFQGVRGRGGESGELSETSGILGIIRENTWKSQELL